MTKPWVLRLLGRTGSVLLIWFAFIALNWSMIGSVSTEVGDFAANSLLVQEAKQLALLEGHYSRFGYFHPGPALLYVLAFGEWAFFDLFAIAGSPLGAQLMAVLLLSAVWLVAIFGLIRMVVRTWAQAVLTAVGFFLVISLISNQFATGVWFPWMYALPFAVFVLAVGLTIAGRSWAVPYVAVAAGFLINGHASFLVIVPIVALVAFGLGAVWLRRLAGPSAPWVIGGVILLVFVLPLLIRTVTAFPGPLAEYFFGDRETAGLGLRAAFDFTAGAWGGPGMAAVVVLVLVLLWVTDRVTDLGGYAVRGIVIAIASAWVGAYVYAVFGVDDAANTYLLWFFAVMPGVLAIAVFSSITTHLDAANRPVPSLVAVALAVVLVIIAAPTYGGGVYPADYNNPEVPVIADALTEIPRVGRVVLDLDNSEDWSAVWSPIMGVAVELARRGDDVICIGANWHIGFGSDLRCTDTELAQGRSFVVRPGSTTVPAVLSVGGLAFTAQ